MKVLDLFSGIGGMSLGLERAGMETVAFCEVLEFPRKVLRKHWPDVPIYKDVRELTNDTLKKDKVYPDVIAGGFPCQDISTAGKQKGIHGKRSNLWSEFKRLIRDVQPKWALIENVSSLRYQGLALVLQDLWEVGYDAEWHCISASDIGAPHQRDRLWIVAYPNHERLLEPSVSQGNGAYVCHGKKRQEKTFQPSGSYSSSLLSRELRQARDVLKSSNLWASEPLLDRVVDGVPDRVDRIKSLGNSVVPQIPYLIGRAIINSKKVPYTP